MDILRIFRMQEPVSKSLLTNKQEHNSESNKEVVQEKDVLIRNNKSKIKQLEAEVSELKKANQNLEVRLKATTLDDNGLQQIMLNYDEYFKKIWNEREDLLVKGAVLDIYLENLEVSYNELLEKFQQAKEIILGMKANQDILINELKEHKEIIKVLQDKFDNLKEHSESTIEKANMHIDLQRKENVEEVAKLKSKIIQRQTKIKELEKQMNFQDAKPLLVPLRNKMADRQ